MKTVFAKPLKKSRRIGGAGFTLMELLVVLGLVAVLIVVQLPALAGAKSQTKIAMCAAHVRQIALSCQVFANDNSDQLPVVTGSAVWAWDLPVSAADALLKSGVQTNTFYCPGTAPRFTDQQNWSGPGSTLWNFGVGSGFHIVGYALAFSGMASMLAATNQNTTIQPEVVNNFPAPGMTTRYGVSERVLVADATLSAGAILPGYAHPENNYVSIAGGFTWNGSVYPHVSPHLKGNVPIGGNLGFKDGHVDWRKFELMTPRSSSGGRYFWW